MESETRVAINADLLTASGVFDRGGAVEESSTLSRAASSALEHAAIGIAITTAEGRFVETNRALCSITGYSESELFDLDVASIIHPDDLGRSLDKIAPLISGESAVSANEIRLVKKDGRDMWAECQVSARPGDPGARANIVWLIRDISDRKYMEDALRESEARAQKLAEETLRTREQRFQHLTRNSNDIVCILDESGRMRYLSPSFERILGHNPEDLLGSTPMSFIHADDHAAAHLVMADHLPAPGNAPALEFRIRHADGSWRYFELIAENLLHEPTVGGIVVNFRDISDRKETEEKLLRLAAIVESTDDAITSQTLEGKIASWNSGAEKAYGYKAQEAIGQSAAMLLPPDRQSEARRIIERIRRGERIDSFESVRVRKDGQKITVSVTVSPIKDGAGNVVAASVIARDVTEGRHLQEQLRQAQKMEAVGRLAGGIAHDFNNLLTAINGYSELMMMRLEDTNPLKNCVGEIRKAGDRAAALTRQLLAFSRKQLLQPKVFDLNTVIDEMHKMLHRVIGEDIDLVIDLQPSLSRVKADPGQIEQIILNLVLNARDAMPDGGKLIIETANTSIRSDSFSEFAPQEFSDVVMLSVTDNGCGMDQITQTRIFEPFFTTKEQGKGTGLGLATVYGIVKQSGGCIVAESAVGKGTCFKIYFPGIAEPAECQTAPDDAKRLVGWETLLLVEDEDAVRRLAGEVLRMNGYNVLEASHGGEALSIAEKYDGPVHLMLTDVVMPQMSGRQLAARLTPVRPGMRVIYMSGYTDDVILNAGLENGTPFLHKPFNPQKLVQKVREVLDEPQEG
jgi:PAS domain S-box-containing protein